MADHLFEIEDTDMNSTMPAPEITDVMRAQAKAQANGRPSNFVCVDPDVPDPNGRVPGWAVRGAWPLTPDGVLVAEGYQANPNYRPGPRTRGFPLPTNGLERALELVAAGYAPNNALLTALAEATLILPTVPGTSDQVPIGSDAAGAALLVAYTSPARVPRAMAGVVTLRTRELAGMLAGVRFQLNPGSIPSLTLPGDDLVAFLR